MASSKVLRRSTAHVRVPSRRSHLKTSTALSIRRSTTLINSNGSANLSLHQLLDRLATERPTALPLAEAFLTKLLIVPAGPAIRDGVLVMK